MNTTIDNTLLAFLLALKNLKNPLNTEELEALADVGQQLKFNPNDWDCIEDDLMDIIQGNNTLNQLYQKAKAKLDVCDRPIPTDLLPTDAELENALPRESKGGTRAHFEGKPDEQSKEILNLTTNVVSAEKPEETAKKLSFLERLSQSLNQPSKND